MYVSPMFLALLLSKLKVVKKLQEKKKTMVKFFNKGDNAKLTFLFLHRTLNFHNKTVMNSSSVSTIFQIYFVCFFAIYYFFYL